MEEKKLLKNLLIGIFGDIRKSYDNGNQISFDCPECSAEKGVEYDFKGNFEFNLEIGKCNCWACGEINNTKGDISYAIKRFGSKSDYEFFKNLNIDFDNPNEDAKVKKEKLIKNQEKINNLKLPENYIFWRDADPKDLFHNMAIDYLKNVRKIDDKSLDKFKIGFCVEGKYAGRILIPSFDKNDKLNFFVTRTFLEHKNKYDNVEIIKGEIIFNEKFIDYNEDIYVCEGPLDYIRFDNAVLLLGKKLSVKLYKDLYFKAKKNIIIALDPDALDDAYKLYRQLNSGRLNGRVRILKLKEHDVSKLYEIYGREKFNQIIKLHKRIKEHKI